MGWVWEDESRSTSDVAKLENPNPRSDDQCSTRKRVKFQCRTEEVEPGKFVRKCDKTEQIFKDCLGRPSEVVQLNKEYTEEDVTDQVMKGSFPLGSSDIAPFDFPGLRGDIEAIERNLFGGIGRFFEAAEEMKNGFFNALRVPHLYDGETPSSSRRGIPIEGHPPKQASPPPKVNNSDGHVDLSGLASDV